MSTRHFFVPRLLAAAALVAGAFVVAPVAGAQTCAYNSTQSTCACPTSGAGTSCFGGQLFKASDNSCQNDVRPCLSNQNWDCSSESCVCNTASYPCGGCTAASSTIGASCGAPTNGKYTNVCGACSCPSGTTLCSSSNTCVTTLSCPAGTSFDPCTNACGTPNVLLSPGWIQSGYIQVNGDVKSTGGNLRLDLATGGGQGDFYMANTKAIRVDGPGATYVNMGNWDPSGTGTQLNIIGLLNATQVCIAGNCRGAWPGVTDFDPTYVNVTGDTMTGDLNLTGATTDIFVAGKVGVGTTAPQNKLDVAGSLAIGSAFAGVTAAPANGLLVQGPTSIGPTGIMYSNQLLNVIAAGPTTNPLFTVRDNSAGVEMDFSRNTILQRGSNLVLDVFAAEGDVDIRTSGTSKVYVQRDLSGGNVGIGTTGPAAKLDVNGTAKMTGFILPTGAAAGKVLVSDASGAGTWQTPPGISGSGTTNYVPKFTSASTLGNSRISDDGALVTIAPASPSRVAIGLSAAAGSDGAVAIGLRANASGFYATAVGQDAVASNSAALALGGGGAIASGFMSTAIGSYVTASGLMSAVFGSGVSSVDPLVNSTGNSLSIGFNSNVPSLFVGPSSGAGTSGNVGVNNGSPIAKFQVTNGSVLFDGATGAIPTTGAGTRLMWYPAKQAFRAGKVTSTTWDDLNVGAGSAAFGDDTTASAVDSFAFGSGSSASGQYSTAGGLNSAASGNGTIAIGWGAHAAGGVGLGDNVYATGSDSVALGFASQATATSSTVSGYQSTGSGFASTSMGYNNTSSGYAATTFGQANTAAGNRSVAMGMQNTANGEGSVALGGYNSAGVAGYGTAVGYASSAGGMYSFAGGYAANASGDQSFAFGQSPLASGYSSFALGQYVTSSATYSSSFGDFITNSGYKSVTIGNGVDGTASGLLANSVGYSIMLGTNSNLPTMTITNGGGAGSTGRVGIATSAPGAKLHVVAGATSGSAAVQAGASEAVQSGTNNYINFINTADNGTNAGLVMTDNNNGGYVDFHNYDGGALSDSMVYGAYQDHVFQAGSSDIINGKAEVMRIKQNGDVNLNGKHAFRSNDSWLRLNQDGAFSSGVHTPGNFAPGALNVGGANGWGNPGSGNAWIAGNMVVYGSLYLSGWRSTWPYWGETTSAQNLYAASSGWQYPSCPGGYVMTGWAGYNCQAGGCTRTYGYSSSMAVWIDAGYTAYMVLYCGANL